MVYASIVLVLIRLKKTQPLLYYSPYAQQKSRDKPVATLECWVKRDDQWWQRAKIIVEEPLSWWSIQETVCVRQTMMRMHSDHPFLSPWCLNYKWNGGKIHDLLLQKWTNNSTWCSTFNFSHYIFLIRQRKQNRQKSAFYRRCGV